MEKVPSLTDKSIEQRSERQSDEGWQLGAFLCEFAQSEENMFNF